MPSFEKNKSSGLWSCRFRETDELGVPHQKRLSGFKTKKEAQYGYEDYIKSADERRKQKESEEAAKAASPDEMLFNDLLNEYMNFTQKRVKESSFYDIESKVRNRLQPFFEGKRMNEITPKLISDWIENIDYSYSSRVWIFSTLASVYKYGNKYYDITNIMTKVDRPRDTSLPKEMQIWTPEEFSRFIEHVSPTVYEMYFRTLYILGCRRGEALALRWSDVNAANNTVRINKSLTTKTTSGPYVITTPKNKGSVRTVAAPKFFIEQLERHKAEQKNALGEKWTESTFIFARKDGNDPLAPSSIDRAYNLAIQASGVKKIRIHDLRHSCASVLISKGVSIVAVGKQLGHANVEETLNTYAHMMPDDTTLIRNTLENLGTLLSSENDQPRPSCA